jgi:hypothetical protein
MSQASGMKSGGSTRRKTVKRRASYSRTVRGIAPSRVAQGNWNIFGLVHGGKEGKQWQKAKDAVTTAQTHIQSEVQKMKQFYVVQIMKKGKLSSDDKSRLINQIRGMTFR